MRRLVGVELLPLLSGDTCTVEQVIISSSVGVYQLFG